MAQGKGKGVPPLPPVHKVSRVAMREQLESSFMDVAEMLRSNVESHGRLLEEMGRLRAMWREMGLGEPPEFEVQARVVGDVEPRRRSAG